MLKERIIWQGDGLSIEERIPKLTDLLCCGLRKNTAHEMVRWFLQYPFGYRVFTLQRAEDEKESMAGNPRYPFLERDDILVGPYYVCEEERGHRYASMLISECVRQFQGIKSCAWAFIAQGNVPTVRTAEASGFTFVQYAAYSRLLRRLIPRDSCSSDNVLLFRKEI